MDSGVWVKGDEGGGLRREASGVHQSVTETEEGKEGERGGVTEGDKMVERAVVRGVEGETERSGEGGTRCTGLKFSGRKCVAGCLPPPPPVPRRGPRPMNNVRQIGTGRGGRNGGGMKALSPGR